MSTVWFYFHRIRIAAAGNDCVYHSESAAGNERFPKRTTPHRSGANVLFSFSFAFAERPRMIIKLYEYVSHSLLRHRHAPSPFPMDNCSSSSSSSGNRVADLRRFTWHNSIVWKTVIVWWVKNRVIGIETKWARTVLFV